MSIDYSMRISRLTVDKLGVKLYDKASAVIAELIANAYDADATNVIVRAPMGKYLAKKVKQKNGKKRITDLGFTIEVEDNGIGMTPTEVQEFFLVIGSERRDDPKRGSVSKKLNRNVMGRKGVGKLAPFGICKTIEVISSGGDEVTEVVCGNKVTGYRTSHILLNYDRIRELGEEPDERYEPETGKLDDALRPTTGTKIVLKRFNYRKVNPIGILSRQIAQRFGIRSPDWEVKLQDNFKKKGKSQTVGEFAVRTMPNTKLMFQSDQSVIGPDGNVLSDLKAGFVHEESFYSLHGWMAYAYAPYKDELMAGVRIYCRGKIAAQTLVFNQKAGFTGEHNIRSYLVGELHADWLDEEDDLIQTDRRDILWSEELATKFQTWGQKIVKRIGTLSRDPMRQATLEIFLETGNVDARIQDTFPHDDLANIRENALDLACIFGRTIKRVDAKDNAVVGELVDLSLRLAPHVTLNDMMKKAVDIVDEPLLVLTSFLKTARLAELSSFGEIAEDRLKVIDRLTDLKDEKGTSERDLQQLIEDAPWLINPEWAPVTENQAFSTLRSEFEKYYTAETGIEISLASFDDAGRRPDFVMASQEGIVQIIEIKTSDHTLTNDEMDRIVSYHDIMGAFLKDPANSDFNRHFKDFHITVVCDKLGLTISRNAAFNGYRGARKLTHMTWRNFLFKTREVHQDFLKEASRQRKMVVKPAKKVKVA